MTLPMNVSHEDKKEDIPVEELGEIRSIVVQLSSTNKSYINTAAKTFYEFVRELKEEIDLPKITPTEEAVFTTRRSPCGNGTATYVRHTMRVYLREFSLNIHDKNITKIAEFLKESPARAQIQML